jgi:hypothetical protein
VGNSVPSYPIFARCKIASIARLWQDSNLAETLRWLVDAFRGEPARGGTPRDAEFSVIKTHVSRGFWWYA